MEKPDGPATMPEPVAAAAHNMVPAVSHASACTADASHTSCTP
jgi:hypothetical protein